MKVDVNCMKLESCERNFDILWIGLQTPIFGDLAVDVGAHFASQKGVHVVCHIALDLKKTFVSNQKSLFAPRQFSIWSEFGVKTVAIENNAGKMFGWTCANHLSFPTLCTSLWNYDGNNVHANSCDCAVSYVAKGVSNAQKNTKFVSLCAQEESDYEDVAVGLANYLSRL